MEGLFRVPGPAAYTDDLRKAFEEGEPSLLGVESVVTCVECRSRPSGVCEQEGGHCRSGQRSQGLLQRIENSPLSNRALQGVYWLHT